VKRDLTVECFTTPRGKRWLATDDGENVIITTCASAGAACGCDPTYCPQARALTATLPPVGRGFDSMKPTIGDLVGKNINNSRMQISASLPWRPFDPKRPTVGDLVEAGRRLGTSQELSNPIQLCPHDSPCRALHVRLGSPCTGILCGLSGASAAVVNANGAGHFDPMQPTIGDLVGTKTVEAAASCPPVVRRIDGRFDPTQPTVGDLTVRKRVRAHAISVEPDDFLVHPSTVKEVSR
jgi:hypothetical protein